MTESWECPKCQTLNAFGDHCYSCGALRPDAPAETRMASDASPNAEADWAIPPPLDSTDPVDTEPHPCWCNLVKGPHDTRDHPASASAGPETEDDIQADTDLDQVEAELGLLTHDWTDLTVKRTYDSGDDGEQQYEDEAMLFEEHGYTKWVDRPSHMINATYTIGDGLPDKE